MVPQASSSISLQAELHVKDLGDCLTTRICVDEGTAQISGSRPVMHTFTVVSLSAVIVVIVQRY